MLIDWPGGAWVRERPGGILVVHGIGGDLDGPEAIWGSLAGS
jgi:hypothetical protein